jgi:hypothetical protein
MAGNALRGEIQAAPWYMHFAIISYGSSMVVSGMLSKWLNDRNAPARSGFCDSFHPQSIKEVFQASRLKDHFACCLFQRIRITCRQSTNVVTCDLARHIATTINILSRSSPSSPRPKNSGDTERNS